MFLDLTILQFLVGFVNSCNDCSKYNSRAVSDSRLARCPGRLCPEENFKKALPFVQQSVNFKDAFYEKHIFNYFLCSYHIRIPEVKVIVNRDRRLVVI